MPMFLLLENKIENGDVWIDEYDVPEAYDFDSNQGIPIPLSQEKPSMFYKNKTARKTDFVAGIFSFPVISVRFKSLLESIGEIHIEYLPLQLVCRKNNETDKSYFLLNLLDNIPCFDWDHSEYEETLPGGTPFGITSLRILGEKLKNRNIMRIAEVPSLIIVSEPLRIKIEEQGLTGMEFMPLSEYSSFELP